MKLLYASDLHGNRAVYERLLKRAAMDDVDALVIGGDLGPRGGSSLKEWVAFQRTFLEDYLVPICTDFRLQHPQKRIFVIMGNDDFRSNIDILQGADARGVISYIHGTSISLGNGFFIAGYSFVNITPFRLKDWEKKDFADSADPQQISPEVLRSTPEEKGTIADDLEKLRTLSDPQKTIYVIHVPPFDTNLDIITSGQHVGSKAVRQFIEKHNPLATMHGHIHESHQMSGSWMDVLGSTLCVNVGSLHMMDKLPCCIIDTAKVHTAVYEELSLHL